MLDSTTISTTNNRLVYIPWTSENNKNTTNNVCRQQLNKHKNISPANSLSSSTTTSSSTSNNLVIEEKKLKRNSSITTNKLKQLPEVVAEAIRRQKSQRQEGGQSLRINERESISLKHTVERSQSQLSRAPAGVLSPWMSGHGRSTSRHSHSGGVNNNNLRSSADQLTENKIKNSSNSSPNSIPQLTIVLMGAPKTGKSALVSQFLWECFLSEYRPTVEEFNWVEYGCTDQKNGPNFMLQIIDSSGSRDFLAMRHLYYRIADAFMVVYAADDPQSYTEALTMLKEIEEQNSKNAPILLLQNKSDLMPRNVKGNITPPSPELLPEEEKNEQLLIFSVRRMRASAKNLEQVKGAFSWLIEELVRHSKNILTETQNDGKRRPTIISAENNNNFANKGRRRNGSGPTTGFLPSNTGKVALLTRRRQSMPSRRTASELGIDEQALKQFMKRYETQQGRNGVGCCIQ